MRLISDVAGALQCQYSTSILLKFPCATPENSDYRPSGIAHFVPPIRSIFSLFRSRFLVTGDLPVSDWSVSRAGGVSLRGFFLVKTSVKLSYLYYLNMSLYSLLYILYENRDRQLPPVLYIFV